MNTLVTFKVATAAEKLLLNCLLNSITFQALMGYVAIHIRMAGKRVIKLVLLIFSLI
jgi:hypothetical protein